MNVNNRLWIPHLDTYQARPFSTLETTILSQKTTIEAWFKSQWQKNNLILTSSTDLRNAGFKISTIDTNLFPAGFNNLDPSVYPYFIQAAQNTLQQYYPRCRQILILPENHTRNPHYYKSIAVLVHILEESGYEVRVGSLLAEEKPFVINTPLKTLTLFPVIQKDNRLYCHDFDPCVIILNNDLSEGLPDSLQGLAQPIEPLPSLGWFNRSKTQHFAYYQEICQTFSDHIGLDSWQISPLFRTCNEVNFLQKEGMECLVPKVEDLLMEIQKKYDEYQIKDRPFVVVKADAGTYGMAIMSIHDPAELNQLNRKQRTSMSKRKGGQTVHQVIIQEGIPTVDQIRHSHHPAVAEPVIYMFGPYVIGGFYRTHALRKTTQNLNAPGMHFEKLPLMPCCQSGPLISHDVPDLFYVYSVIARLGLLAAGREKMERITHAS